VLAFGADLLGTKICVAAVAFAVHPLAHFLVDQILTASPARNGEAIRNVSLALLVTRRSLCGDLLGALALVLRLLDRVSGAPLAPLVATLKAGLVGSVRGVALVARAMDSHANVLLDAGARRSGGERQVGCLDIEAVFLEEGLGALRGAHHWRRGGWDSGRSVGFGLFGGEAGRRPAENIRQQSSFVRPNIQAATYLEGPAAEELAAAGAVVVLNSAAAGIGSVGDARDPDDLCDFPEV
jgi:hypothetical protein